MKRWITLVSSALFSMAVATPLMAGDGMVRQLGETAAPSGKTAPAQAVAAPSAKATPVEVRRSKARVSGSRAMRLEDMKRDRRTQKPRPPTSTIPNQLVPGDMMNRAPSVEQGTKAPSTDAKSSEPRQATPIIGATPSADLSFGGYDNSDNVIAVGSLVAPPDTNGDVGEFLYVQWNNLGFKIFDKATGADLSGPLAGNSLWPAGTACGDNNNGDPIVLYDHVAGIWVFTQFMISGPEAGLACFATWDIAGNGPINTWEFDIALEGFNDYPKMGLWVTEEGHEGSANVNGSGRQSAYHMTTNEFGAAGFIGVNVTAFDRDAILAGDPGAGFVQFTIPPVPNADGRFAFGIQPPNLEGWPLPPAGTCAPYIQAFDDAIWGDGTGDDGYRLWEFCTAFGDAEPPPPSGVTACSVPVDGTIPDGGEEAEPPEFLTDSIEITGETGTIADLDVSINASHTWVGDLSFSLAGDQENNPEAELIFHQCPGSDRVDINTTLDDAATDPVGAVCNGVAPAIDAGPYRPEQLLSDFNLKDINGVYTLTAGDDTDLDEGTLNEWCVIINGGGSPGGGGLPTDPAAPGDETFTELDFVPTTLPFDAEPFQVPQPNGQFLDTLSQFTMYRFSVRMTPAGFDMASPEPAFNGGPYVLTGVISHTVNVGDSGDFSNAVASVDSFGDGDNVVVLADFGEPVLVDGFGFDWGIATFAPSFLSEAQYSITDDLITTGVTITPGVGDNFPGANEYSTGGIVNLDGLSFSSPNGMLRVEFHESFDDFPGAIDAFAGGTLTFRGLPLGGDDTDGDGVPDSIDACPATDWPDTYPTTGRLARGRYTLTTPPDFDIGPGTIKPPPKSLADTNGCSCDQLIDGGFLVGSFRSESRRGCTLGTMENAPVVEGDPGGDSEIIVTIDDFSIELPEAMAGSQWARFRLTEPGANAAPITPVLMDTGVADGGLADGLHRWMPSVTQDAVGNMAIVYSRSGDGAGEFPSVYFAGREAGDPAGTLQAESTCIDGTGSQSGIDRWGDYASASLDPVDQCTFWVTNEYVETTGDFEWDTQICTFKFDSCEEVEVPQ